MLFLAITTSFLLAFSNCGAHSAKSVNTSGSLLSNVENSVATEEFEYPDVSLIYIPPGVEPEYAYFPSPDDDGTYIQVVMQDEFFPPGAPAPAASPFPPVRFYLYTEKNPDTPIELYNSKSNKEDAASYFDAEAPVKILCHGYMSNSNKKFPDLMRQAYLNLGQNLNVILIDWRSMADTPFYPRAARDTKKVGEHTALLLQQLIADGLTQLSKVHFIGHSLGAQSGGAVAYQLDRKNLGKMDRITGLDPAGPWFCNEENKRLHGDDAEFVDVIHTDDGLYCKNWFETVKQIAKGKWGSSLTVGTADFYPNGGAHQIGCGTGKLDSCSHSRSYYYMEESFNATEAKAGYVFTRRIPDLRSE